MRAFRHQPIQRKLLLILLATIAAVLALVMIGIVVYETVTYGDRLARQMRQTARFIAANSAPALAFNDPQTAREILTTLAAYPEITLAVLYTAEGKVLAAFHPYQQLVVVPTLPPPEGLRFSGGELELTVPVEQGGRRLGTLLLCAVPADLLPRLAPYAGILLVAALAIGGGAAILQRMLQWKVSAPLLQLSHTAERIAGGDLAARVPEQSEDEIGQLARSFNHMAAQLAHSYAELERRVEQRTAELSAANRELEAFTYSVSHDLRAPLRHITSFIDMLAAESGSALDAQGRRYVEIVADSARRMDTLIDDLLAFSRLGRTSMHPVRIDMRHLVEEARRELAPETRDRRIEWNIGDLPRVKGDPVLLRTVLVNLLGNAVKYTRRRDPARIEVGGREEGSEIVFFVRDNGAGFDMRFAEKLFGVFQRLHSAGEFEGTGIGLASVRRIVQRHGGRTWAQGEVGRGACFFFSLPKGNRTGE